MTGAWRAPLRLKAKMWGAGLDADTDGSAEPWAQEPKASVNLKVRSADLGPLLDLKPSDTLAQDIRLSSRVSLAGNRLTFDDLDSIIAGSRLRGRLALTLGDEKNIEGEIGLDQLALAPAFALAIGAAGHDAAEPLVGGLVKGWRGQVAFQALRGVLPGGSELQPVSGTGQERRPVADVRCHQGQDRRRRSERQYRRQTGSERNCAECERSALRRRRHGVALSQPRNAGRPRVDADGADKPGPQRVGAVGRAVRQRNRDAGIRTDRRPRSARLRGGGPRQRQRSGKGRRRG